jgi:hypothetical protein
MDELKILENLPTLEEREWSFLETIGASRKETIMANLLAYYFDPNEKHGLKDTFLKALLQTVPFYLKIKEKIKIDSIEKERDKHQEKLILLKEFTNDNYSFEWANIIVEDSTDKNKRIDIVIETNELVIAIEFKINHHLDNPLESYFNYIQGINKNGTENPNAKYHGKQKYYIVLTPNWKMPSERAKKNDDFVQITLAGFIENVKKIIEVNDFFKGRENLHQFYIYQDFINTIENRGKETTMVNEYFKRFNQKNEDNQKIEDIYKYLSSIKKEIEKKVIELSKDTDLNFRPLLSKETIQSALIHTKADKTQIKIRLSLKGWYGERWIYKTKKNEQYLGSFEDSLEIIKSKINDYYSKE